MSFEGHKTQERDLKEGRAPRSLTLTFAETNPWEMLVRDRLVALPRGYLKRFLLLLLEGSGLDLSDEAVFQAQVERFLLTKSLASAVGHRPTEGEDARAKTTEQPPRVTLNFAHNSVVSEEVEPAAEARPSLPSPASLPASKRPVPQPFKDGGFGALEL